jgi:hypothetical protein
VSAEFVSFNLDLGRVRPCNSVFKILICASSVFECENRRCYIIVSYGKGIATDQLLLLQ